MPKNFTESGILKIDITEPSSMHRKAEETIMLAGVHWSFSATLPNCKGEPDLTFTLKCRENMNSTLWWYQVDGQFLMTNHKFPESSYRKNIHQTFNYSTQYVEFFLAKRLSELVNPKSGFTEKHGAWSVGIFMEAHLTVTAHPGVHRLPTEDFRAPRDRIRESVLLVNGEKLYVCKQMISMTSSFFHALFYPTTPSEGEESVEITVEGVKTSEFIEFLHLIHSPGHRLHAGNVHYLLELCDRFGCDQLLRRIGNELMYMPDVMLWRKFQLAEIYQLLELQEACLTTFKTLCPKDADYQIHMIKKMKVSEHTIRRLTGLRRLLNNRKRKDVEKDSQQSVIDLF